MEVPNAWKNAPTEPVMKKVSRAFGTVALGTMMLLPEAAVAEAKAVTENVYDFHIGQTTPRVEKRRNRQKTLQRVRDLKSYRVGWDGAGAAIPSQTAYDEAEKLISLLPFEGIVQPRVSIATDGELAFYWSIGNRCLDLGFEQDGTFSYFGCKENGQSIFLDAGRVADGVPSELFELLDDFRQG